LFIKFAFNLRELHEMFKEFHMRFFSKYHIGTTELTSLIEIMGREDMLGRVTMEEEVFPVMGVEQGLDLGILNKETKTRN